jgi:hypothetical protein
MVDFLKPRAHEREPVAAVSSPSLDPLSRFNGTAEERGDPQRNGLGATRRILFPRRCREALASFYRGVGKAVAFAFLLKTPREIGHFLYCLKLFSQG